MEIHAKNPDLVINPSLPEPLVRDLPYRAKVTIQKQNPISAAYLTGETFGLEAVVENGDVYIQGTPNNSGTIHPYLTVTDGYVWSFEQL